MGSKTAASNRSVASGMEQSKKDTKTIGLIQASEKYAKEKLGITKMISNPNQPAVRGNVKGYMALNTGGNQMYGDKYREAQGEFLASKGLATAREITDATGKKFTVYDKSKEYMDAVNKTSIPLSKQMFESQGKFKLAVAALTGLAGVPLLPTILTNQAMTPYMDYVQKKEGGFYNKGGLVGKFLLSNKDNQPQQSNQQTNQNEENQFVASNRKKKVAGIGASDTTQGRTFFS